MGALKAVKEKKHHYCLLYLDLDQFKIVNDLCGHSAGDVLLKNLSQRLYRTVDLINNKHINLPIKRKCQSITV